MKLMKTYSFKTITAESLKHSPGDLPPSIKSVLRRGKKKQKPSNHNANI